MPRQTVVLPRLPWRKCWLSRPNFFPSFYWLYSSFQNGPEGVIWPNHNSNLSFKKFLTLLSLSTLLQPCKKEDEFWTIINFFPPVSSQWLQMINLICNQLQVRALWYSMTIFSMVIMNTTIKKLSGQPSSLEMLTSLWVHRPCISVLMSHMIH